MRVLVARIGRLDCRCRRLDEKLETRSPHYQRTDEEGAYSPEEREPIRVEGVAEKTCVHQRVKIGTRSAESDEQRTKRECCWRRGELVENVSRLP